MFTTTEFTYRTCANGADHKGRRYDSDVNGHLYSILFLSVTDGDPVRYEIDGNPASRVRSHVDLINHFKLHAHIETLTGA